MKITDRLKHAWNAFFSRDQTVNTFANIGPGYGVRPDRVRLHGGNERSIINAIFNRIAMDIASISIQHVRLDFNNRYIETIDSGLNNCLTSEANIDQTGRAFIQNAVLSMFDSGCIAIVPVDTNIDPMTGSYDIRTLRVGTILDWYPQHVKVNLYNDRTGQKEDITLPKKNVAIIENPLYSVMNDRNSTLQRLIRKLNILDVIDDQSGSGKLNMIIQLPYVVKTEARKIQAEQRRKDIEMQLAESKYGIAYTDGTEKITQINGQVDNNLMEQIEYLTNMLYNQLGMPASIFDGTADEATMLNYYNRTCEPIMAAFVDEFKRKFLTKTARTQGQSIMAFREPLKLTPTMELANIADVFTRNEILTSNEIRQILGMKPSDDPGADELRNKNMPIEDTGASMGLEENYETEPYEEAPYTVENGGQPIEEI